MSDTALNFRVVHPLDDAPEQKLYRADLGRMPMTRTVKCSLFLLQAYLVLMLALVGWRVLSVAGVV